MAAASSRCECGGEDAGVDRRSKCRIPASESRAEVLRRLFEFGFTTKKDGHGFGLHTSAILAKELAGDLSAFSEGPGHGARFALRLPSSAAELRRQA